jgi:hypothetical protein
MRACAASCRAREVGTMSSFSRTNNGSASSTRSRFSAALIAGWVWSSCRAVRDTLRSSTSAQSTRSR